MSDVHSLIIVWWTSVLLVIILVVLRFFLLLRTHHLCHPSPQDFFLLLTCILSISVAGVGTAFITYTQRAQTRLGPLGIVFLTNAEKERILRLGWVGYLLSILVLCVAKATLFTLYLTVYSRLPRPMRIGLVVSVVYAMVGTIALFLVHLLHCGRDLSVNWRIQGVVTYRRRCVAQSSVTLSTLLTIFSVSVDIILMVLGYLTLRLLHVSRRREYVALGFVFAIGFLSAISSLVRFGSLVSRLGATENPSWGGIEFYTTWISIETMCAALACSLPSLRGLIHHAAVAHSSGSGDSSSIAMSRRRGSTPNMGATKMLVDVEMVEVPRSPPPAQMRSVFEF